MANSVGFERFFVSGSRTARRLFGAACLSGFLAQTAPSGATPPEFKTFRREQRAAVAVNQNELLRIWVVYVGQGDGILIQFPERASRRRADGSRERVDVMVDAGAQPGGDTQRMRRFLTELYPEHPVQIEHAVITHHDQDHVLGLTAILESRDVAVERIYHNGLATFAPGKRGLPKVKPAGPAVVELKSGLMTRGLGLLDGEDRFLPAFVMDDLAELRSSQTRGELASVYADLAAALVGKTEPSAVTSFDRARVGGDFVNEAEAAAGTPNAGDVELEVLWPDTALRKFGDMGKTINGNSVTFRLRYRDFEMLFTGDHNEPSQEALLEHLRGSGELDKLKADILKVPHHGSDDSLEEFLGAVAPVLSVASQGARGAQFKHPSPRIIELLGGAHRVYLTEFHERKFSWDAIGSAEDLEALRERTHVVIETDGRWFRVVEVPAPAAPDGDFVLQVPTMTKTKRGDGTRWVRAR